MKGTEKQVKWAQDIINDRLISCDKTIAMYTPYAEKSTWHAEQVECAKIIKAAFEKLFAHEKCQDAAYIINNRNNLPMLSEILTKADGLAKKEKISKVEACKKLCEF